MRKKLRISVVLSLLFLLFRCSSYPVLTAVENKSLDQVKKAVEEKKADPNETACLGALTLAAWNGNADIVEYLLSKGADPNQRGKQCEFKDNRPFIGRIRLINRTPLQGVTDAVIARMLISKGANVSLGGFIEYRFGGTDLQPPLLQAIDSVSPELVELYLKNKVNLRVFDDSGINVFDSALRRMKNKKDEDPVKKSKIHALLEGKLPRLAVTEEAYNATEGKVLREYKNIYTGSVTVMPADTAQTLYDNPKTFVPITLNSGDGKYYHHSEFNWSTGQNMYEWYLIRSLIKDKRKKKK